MNPLEILNTVKIRVEPSEGNPEGSLIINAVDFDEKVHVLFEVIAEEASSTEAKPWAKTKK